MKKKGTVLFFGLGVLFYSYSSYAQYNILGKPGLVLTPKPALENHEEGLFLGYSYLPKDFALNNFVRKRDDEDYYVANLDFIKRVKVNLAITQLRNTARTGIGDRHIDVQVALLYQKKWLPNVSLIVSPTIKGSNSLTHNLIVMSRYWDLGKRFRAEFSGGYGLPVIYMKPYKNWKFPSENYQWIDKSRIGNNYLSGFFGGMLLSYNDLIWLAAEHDSQYINLSASVLIKKSIFLRGSYLGLEAFTYGFGYKFNLSSTPNVVKKHELQQY